MAITGILAPMDTAPMEHVDRMEAGSIGRMGIVDMLGGWIRALVS